MAETPNPAPAQSTVTLKIDGQSVTVPKGTNVLEAARSLGVSISFFCYHPGLSSPAVCRQCLVEVKGQPKPVPSCYTPCADNMDVLTQSEKALTVRQQMLEFTLVNHPVDCPICDKAGECTLQKLYVEWDSAHARMDYEKVHKPKKVDLGPTIVLDAERCILCTRCIRVCDEVAHDHQLEMSYRGDR
ncbi:MAG: 2Fe-2S iron-sulfur cluster-binding protein, partial [Polyangia bacterium]